MIMATKSYRHYLCGKRFLIRADHRALKWLLKFKNPKSQMARTLATCNFVIEPHRPSLQHDNADFLSRRPCGDFKYCEQAEQKEHE